jgi:hypothetical protein
MKLVIFSVGFLAGVVAASCTEDDVTAILKDDDANISFDCSSCLTTTKEQDDNWKACSPSLCEEAPASCQSFIVFADGTCEKSAEIQKMQGCMPYALCYFDKCPKESAVTPADTLDPNDPCYEDKKRMAELQARPACKGAMDALGPGMNGKVKKADMDSFCMECANDFVSETKDGLPCQVEAMVAAFKLLGVQNLNSRSLERKLVRQLESSAKAMCSKNANQDYCVQLNGDDDECSMLQTSGCCAGTLLTLNEDEKKLDAPSAKEFAKECAITDFPRDCPGPGETVKHVAGSFNMKFNFSSYDSLTTKQKRKVLFAMAEDVAKKVQVSAVDCEIRIEKGTKNGESKIHVRVTPQTTGKEADIATKFADMATADFTATAKVLNEENVIKETAITPEAPTATEDENTGDGATDLGVNPAAMLVPSLSLALALIYASVMFQ